MYATAAHHRRMVVAATSQRKHQIRRASFLTIVISGPIMLRPRVHGAAEAFAQGGAVGPARPGRVAQGNPGASFQNRPSGMRMMSPGISLTLARGSPDWTRSLSRSG